jgi:hypothetical protein
MRYRRALMPPIVTIPSTEACGDPGNEGERRVVGDVLKDRRDRGMRRGIDQEGVAVGIGARDHGGAGHAAGADPIFQHQSLAERLRQRLKQETRNHIDRAAGGKRRIQADGAGRPGLCAGQAWRKRETAATPRRCGNWRRRRGMACVSSECGVIVRESVTIAERRLVKRRAWQRR